MGNPEHMRIALTSVAEWNEWRSNNLRVQPDLTRIDLSSRDLRGVDFRGVGLFKANLSNANLERAILRQSIMIKTDLTGANLNGAYVYGASVWDVSLAGANQSGLIITDRDQPVITVDDLEMAQFIYLLLNHENLRRALNSVMDRGVLILGRFGGGGIEILRELAATLRELKYLPIIFDFERPRDRNFTETVQVLAGLSRFVVTDLSGPSVPQELYATVPHFKIPFVPILEEGSRPYAMFADIFEYDWVMKPVVEFRDAADLSSKVRMIVEPAEARIAKRQKLLHDLLG